MGTSWLRAHPLMKKTFLTWLASLAQIILAFLVALPAFFFARLARRLLRRGTPGV